MAIRSLLFLLIISLGSCTLSFKNTSISPEVEHFWVGTFESDVFSAPPTVGIIWTERLRDKILQDTRLRYQEVDPHISFSGQIIRYTVQSVAPQQDQGSEINRLEIGIRVKFENIVDDDEWTNTFSFFSDFDRDVNLADVEEDLIQTIYDQLLEDVFNKAFANW